MEKQFTISLEGKQCWGWWIWESTTVRNYGIAPKIDFHLTY